MTSVLMASENIEFDPGKNVFLFLIAKNQFDGREMFAFIGKQKKTKKFHSHSRTKYSQVNEWSFGEFLSDLKVAIWACSVYVQDFG